MATKSSARPLPQRTCVACGTTTNKREPVRIVRTAAGIAAAATGQLAAGGAYVCGAANCGEQALTKGRLGHSLKTRLTAKDADALRAYAAHLRGGS